MKKILIMVSCMLLTCCTNEKSDANASSSPATLASTVAVASSSTKPQTQDPEMNQEAFKPNFIKAADLLKKIQNNEEVYVFDVRDKGSYDEAHIKTALSKPLDIKPESVANVPKTAHVVTYCGCPHHLSSIAAEQLTKMGYTDVHVLDEGFWYWKEHKFPLEVSANSQSKISEMSVAGVLMKNGKPLANTDIYMKHVTSGQMEAEKTDKDGKYKMNFHLYNYKNKDEFQFYVGNLNTPVQSFSTDKKDTDGVIVNAK